MTVDLVTLLAKASTFVRHWRDQDGVNAAVLDELADAVEGYLGDNPLLARATGWIAQRRGMPFEFVGIVRTATNAEQREALERALPHGYVSKVDPGELPDFQLRPLHIELHIDGTSRGDVLVTNRSTVELEVMQADGTSIGLPPTARGMVHPGSSIRTLPGDRGEPVTVTDAEMRWVQQQWRRRGDYLWITRLQDGRALFLMPWNMGGVQLSVGKLGELTFTDTWAFHPGHTEAGWRAVLGWDGFGEPEGWTRHPETGRVRPDGTAASEAVER